MPHQSAEGIQAKQPERHAEGEQDDENRRREEPRRRGSAAAALPCDQPERRGDEDRERRDREPRPRQRDRREQVERLPQIAREEFRGRLLSRLEVEAGQ
jgi:hypothetical protein